MLLEVTQMQNAGLWVISKDKHALIYFTPYQVVAHFNRFIIVFIWEICTGDVFENYSPDMVVHVQVPYYKMWFFFFT